MQVTKVKNMTGNSGREVPNQFIITTPEGEYFQSYQTLIAFKPRHGPTKLDKYAWDYSTTTGKYRNKFLGMNKKETEQAIKQGHIELAELN